MNEVNFNEKDFEYYDYIVEHKKNVMVAFNILYDIELYSNLQGGTFLDITDKNMLNLRSKILNHDLSKFSVDEFDDYRKCFYPQNYIEKETGDFDRAWKCHYGVNSHHPEFWKSKMPKTSMLEMIADWTAMAIKFKSCPLEYYNQKKAKLVEEFGERLDHGYICSVLLKVVPRLENGNICLK